MLQALAAASDKLTADFGTWKTPWGDINRFQRLTDDIVQPFDDAGPSIPVGFTSATWGSLASFGARAYPGTKKMVRHERQQFRRGGRVRRPVSARGPSPPAARAAIRVAALQRSGEALRDRQSARGLLLPDQLKGHTERSIIPESERVSVRASHEETWRILLGIAGLAAILPAGVRRRHRYPPRRESQGLDAYSDPRHQRRQSEGAVARGR